MMEYIRAVNCGQMRVRISRKDGRYEISAIMEKFGDCSAYVFISDEVARALNSGEDSSTLIRRLSQYPCKKKGSGCIHAIAEGLSLFLGSA